MLSPILEFSIFFIVVVIVSFFVKLIKQPIIIGYVLSGIVFSLFFIKKGYNNEQIPLLLLELGIAFLLFFIGLEFNFKNIKYLGKDLVIATSLQTAVFFAIAFACAKLMRFGTLESIYLSILFLFSSTLLVAKWVEDKKETDTLHGKIILGTLIIQDLFAIIALTLLSTIKESSLIGIVLVPVKGIALLLVAFVFGKYLLRGLLKFAVRFPELLFMLSLGVCFFFVRLSPLLGYSTTIGAFVAGVTLANTEYKHEIYSRLKSLIIFFNMFFFVSLGFQVNIKPSLKLLLFVALISVLSLTVKPLVIYLTLKLRGYDMKVSAISALNLSQLSEFSLIIISSAVFSGVISKDFSTIAVISVILTMVFSSYLIKYDKIIFKSLEPFLRYGEKFFSAKKSDSPPVDVTGQDIIFFGYYELGKELLSRFEGMNKKILVVEKDPAKIRALQDEGIPYCYNSVTNPYFFNRFDFSFTELVVSSITDFEENKMIISQVKKDNPKSTIIATAKNIKNSLELYDAGADYVIYPAYVNEQQVSVLLEEYTTDLNKVINKKIKDISKFKELEKKRSSENLFFDINKLFEKLSGREQDQPKNNLNAEQK